MLVLLGCFVELGCASRNRSSLVPLLFSLPLVDFNAVASSGYLAIYQWVNRVEALLWLIAAAVVGWRAGLHPQHPLELIYAIAFVLFALSDFVETAHYPIWLLVWKAVNLLLVIYCRSVLLRNVYTNCSIL